MAERIFPPKKPLNFVIKLEMLKTLHRTDIYVVKNNDENNGFYSTRVKNFRDEILIQYDYDKSQELRTLTYMGHVVAEMELPADIKLTYQHHDILDVCEKIDKKAQRFKEIADAKEAMTKEESLVYQLAKREAQNARYD